MTRSLMFIIIILYKIIEMQGSIQLVIIEFSLTGRTESRAPATLKMDNLSSQCEDDTL